jgi:hypothetical protein
MVLRAQRVLVDRGYLSPRGQAALARELKRYSREFPTPRRFPSNGGGRFCSST